MAELADFAVLKERVTIFQVAEWLGIKLKQQNDGTFRGACPMCKGGGDRILRAYPRTNSYYCYNEEKGGTIIDLVAHFHGCKRADAGKRIQAHFAIDAPRAAPQSEKKTGNFKAQEF